MTDRKGNPLAIGDRVYVLGTDNNSGGPGYVRDIRVIAPIPAERCLVDDREEDDSPTSKSYRWSAWCQSQEVEKI